MKQRIHILIAPFVWAYNKTHWFSDAEAWGVYRFFALAETAGWTLLISSIIYRRLGLPEAASVVSFAGHIHGMIFLCYFIIVFLVARSMQWRMLKISAAVIAGMPPFGSLVFQQIVSYQRKKSPIYVEPPNGFDE